jgi:porin
MAVALLVPILCALAAAGASADEPPPGAWLKRWTAEEPLAGNWFGARDVLQGWGINPTISYATDLQASVAGGLRRGEAYAGQLTVEIDANMEKLVGLTGLRFDVSGAWSSGTDLSLDIGNTFIVAQYFEGGQVRLANMYFEAVAVRRPALRQGGPLLDWL